MNLWDALLYILAASVVVVLTALALAVTVMIGVSLVRQVRDGRGGDSDER